MIMNCKNNSNNDCVVNPRKSTQCSAPEPGKAILSCGSGAAGPLPIIAVGTNVTNPYPVASTTIDIRGMKCPTVLIDFTALINIAVGALPNISFRLVRTVNGVSQAIGGTYTFSNAVGLLESDSFSFQYCDCAQCCGCITYTVEIANATLITAGTSVSGTISALAVEKNCN